MPDTPDKGAVGVNNARLYSAELPDVFGKADTVPWRKKDRWRCEQQHYPTSWNLLAEHCLSAEEAPGMLALFFHWQNGGTIGQFWMLGLGCPGCAFLYSEHLWKKLWIQMAFSVRFPLRPIQRLYWMVFIKSWPYLASVTLVWYMYSPLLHCLEVLGSVDGSQLARSFLPCLLLCLAGLEISVSQA